MNLKKSLWQKDIGQNNFKVLDKNIKTDILIIYYSLQYKLFKFRRIKRNGISF